jgi:two-component system, OmpR family, alkaline phosphatase synthesis response regulator PhoP
MKTILVVDDEPKIVQLVRDYLERAGFAVRIAQDGKVALRLARLEKPDMIVLDLGLPGMDGLDVTRELRKSSNAPILMLTARSEETDKLIGLELGADDYITKPFSPKELVARVRVVFRRIETYSQPDADIIRAADLTLDVTRMQVTAAGRVVEELTPTEFELLATLARQPGRVFTRSQLLDAVHGVAFESYERAIDAHIKNIRRKIERSPRQPVYILSIYGVGYKFNDRWSDQEGTRTG